MNNFSTIINQLSKLENKLDFKIYLVTLLVIGSIFLISLAIYLMTIKKYTAQLNLKANLLDLTKAIDLNSDLEVNLGNILKTIAQTLPASTYAMYIFEEKSENFILKSICNSLDDISLQISYSGIVPYNKEQYIPPMSITKDSITTEPEIITDGAVPLISLPIIDSNIIIRIGPIKKLTKQMTLILNEFRVNLKPVIDIILKNDHDKNEIKIYEKSSHALYNITNIVLNPQTILGSALRIYINSLEASGAFIIHKENETYELISIESQNEQIKLVFYQNSTTLGMFDKLSQEIGVSVISLNDQNYKKLPNYLKAFNFEKIYLANATENGENLIVGYFFDQTTFSSNDETISSTIFMNTCKMCTIYANYKHTKSLTQSYTEILKLTTEIIDSISPKTIGYSELASRYSIVIASELNLDYETISKISLAAFLSDIGNIGFHDEIQNFNLESPDFKIDYPKLHSEISESIIKITLGDNIVASYIRHHHERVDGNGHPDGLRGDEIPIGSKIISVVHAFLTKILGLNNNEPLPFDKALKSLEISAGKQFDSKIVNILIKWFNLKQEDINYAEKTLGNCWDMRCSPPEICYDCPAFKLEINKCWECEDVRCSRHGNSCENCFIKSEFITRKNLITR